jgi:hypothetical protein
MEGLSAVIAGLLVPPVFVVAFVLVLSAMEQALAWFIERIGGR